MPGNVACRKLKIVTHRKVSISGKTLIEHFSGFCQLKRFLGELDDIRFPVELVFPPDRYFPVSATNILLESKIHLDLEVGA